MLIFVGLGLSEGGISVRGFEEAKKANKVFAELYTSLLPEFEIEKLEEKIENNIEILEREDVEENPSNILEASKNGRAVFLVQGDPMVATTHVDLRLRAEKTGIETKIIHGQSIETAAPGLTGLQSYKFGRTATIPFGNKPSETPYDALEENLKRGLHSLFLLDIEKKKKRYLKANEALKILSKTEENLERNVLSEKSLAVVIARAGSSNPLVKANSVGTLSEMNFGPPPHAIIFPGDLHFLEEEALKKLAGCPEEVLESHGGKKAE